MTANTQKWTEVVEIVAPEGHAVCLLGFLPIGDQAFQLQLAGKDEAELRKLRDGLPRLGVLRGEEQARAALQDCIQRLIARGFASRKRQGTQIHFEMRIGDGYEGAALVNSEEHASIVRDMHRRLQAFFSRAVEDVEHAVNAAVTNDDHVGAYAVVNSGAHKGVFHMMATPALLTALQKIDVSKLPREAAADALLIRIHIAGQLRRHGEAVEDARLYELLLGAEINPKVRGELLRLRAVAAQQNEQYELAYAICQQVLADVGITPATRGRAHLALAELNDDAQFITSHLERASDAFLEDGDRDNAASCYVHLAECLYPIDPGRGLILLERATEWFETAKLLERGRRAQLMYTKALLLERLSDWNGAYEAANEAMLLRRGFVGSESEYLYSLHLAMRMAGKAAMGAAICEDITSEIRKAKAALTDLHETVRWRGAALLEGNSTESAETLLADIKATGDREMLFLWYVGPKMESIAGETLERRLANLEIARQILDALPRAWGRSDLEQILAHAFGQAFLQHGNRQRALEWYRRAIALDPFHHQVRQNYLALLFKQAQWPEAASFLERQIQLRGERPGFLLGYGRALLEMGDENRALPQLLRAHAQSPSQEFRDMVQPYIDRAAKRATVVESPLQLQKVGRIVGTRELEQSISRFSDFIKSSKRMTFWALGADRQHDWVSRPEQHAQNLFHTFLKGDLGDAVEVIEEVDAGAGRIDVYVRLSDGTKIVVELKMCGGSRYTKNYARGGIEQLTHYMENKDTKLGYLLVFDGRTQEFGVDLPPRELMGSYSVFIKVVDVRPWVKSHAKYRRAAK